MVTAEHPCSSSPASASGYNNSADATDVQHASTPPEPDLVPWTNIVEDHGWYVSNKDKQAGPDEKNANQTLHNAMQGIMRLLNLSGQIGDKVSNRWMFNPHSEEFTLVKKELKLYMDADDHEDYFKNFKKKHTPPQIFVKSIEGKTLTINLNLSLIHI